MVRSPLNLLKPGILFLLKPRAMTAKEAFKMHADRMSSFYYNPPNNLSSISSSSPIYSFRGLNRLLANARSSANN